MAGDVYACHQAWLISILQIKMANPGLFSHYGIHEGSDCWIDMPGSDAVWQVPELDSPQEEGG